MQSAVILPRGIQGGPNESDEAGNFSDVAITIGHVPEAKTILSVMMLHIVPRPAGRDRPSIHRNLTQMPCRVTIASSRFLNSGGIGSRPFR